MKIFEKIADFKAWRQELADQNRALGFVPTMGALHTGHLSLIEKAARECGTVALSVFVNPTQFNDPKDLEKYPRPLEKDIQLARSAGAAALLLPTAGEIYSDNYRFQVHENQLSGILCGAKRPGHFAGVLTVVLKLLGIADAQKAYFGEKDYQQYLLIRQMAETFFLKTEIVGCPTIREADGLAMSSRNVRLTEEQRRLAPMIFRELSSSKSTEAVRGSLEQAGFRVDYVEEHFGRRFAAVFLGEVRLIDNV